MKRDRAAFTLIELLVVISIIAVLMSIMMPALRKAKYQAGNVLCKNNLRQIGIATVLYAEDYKAYYYVNPGGKLALEPYFGSTNDDNAKLTKVFQCPLDKKNAKGDEILGLIPTSYCVNVYFTLERSNSSFYKEDPSTPFKESYTLKVSDIKRNLADVFYMADQYWTADFSSFISDVSVQGVLWRDKMDWHNVVDSSMLYLDGHVETVNKKEACDRTGMLNRNWHIK